MAMFHPVDLSKDVSNIKPTKTNYKKGKVNGTAATGIHASNDIPNDELPEAGRLDFPDSFTSPIHVVSMNVSGPGDGPGTALRTRKLIADVVIYHEPDLLLFQEFKWQGIKGRAWKDTPLPGHYVYTGNIEASIMYDNRHLQLTALTQTKLQAPLDELKRKGDVSQDFAPLARSSIRLLETKEPDKFKVLVVSWHGVHHKLKEEEKKKQFQDLQAYLKILSEREDAAVLIGGDFNIKMSFIKKLVLPEFILYEYTPSERRKGRKIDYFMASPVLTLTDVEYIDLTKIKVEKDDKGKDAETQDPYRLLDHDPVSTTVTRRSAMEKVIPLPKKFALREIEAGERAS